jgi:hypothetical protein
MMENYTIWGAASSVFMFPLFFALQRERLWTYPTRRAGFLQLTALGGP